MNDNYKLIKIVSRMENLLTAILAVLNQIDEHLPSGEPDETGDSLLHPSEVRQLLGIAPSTLYRYRKNNILIPRGPGGKYYLKSDVLKAGRNNHRQSENTGYDDDNLTHV